MASVFHWVRIKVVCYATEDEGLLHEMMTKLVGADGEGIFEVDISEGLHGNPITVIDAELTKNRDIDRLFANIGSGAVSAVMDELEQRVDDDCILYMRLDKQKAVKGIYEITHSGDVVSVTAKVVSHPAKKEVAVRNAKEYFTRPFRP